jgi:hypothetical protein
MKVVFTTCFILSRYSFNQALFLLFYVYFVVTRADFLVIVCFYLIGCKKWVFCSIRVRVIL